MSLTEVLPEVRAMNRPDQLRLLEILRCDLADDAPPPLAPGDYPVESPYAAFEAAEQLLKLLADAEPKR